MTGHRISGVAAVLTVVLTATACSTKSAGVGSLTNAAAPTAATSGTPAPAPSVPATATATSAKTPTKKPTAAAKPSAPPTAGTPVVTVILDYEVEDVYAPGCNASLSTDGADVVIGAFFKVVLASGTGPTSISVIITNEQNSASNTEQVTVDSQFFVHQDIGPSGTWAGKRVYLDAKISPAGDSNAHDNITAMGMDVPADIASYSPGAMNAVSCHAKIG